MRPLVRLGFAIGLAGAAALVSGCSNFSLDPDKLDFSLFDTKQKIAGERKEVFPGGVPGVTPGVPPEMVKGYHEPDAPPPGEQGRRRAEEAEAETRAEAACGAAQAAAGPDGVGPGRSAHRIDRARSASAGRSVGALAQPAAAAGAAAGPATSGLAGAQPRQVTRAPAHFPSIQRLSFLGRRRDAGGAPP